jgi:hypothetical protein
MITVVTYRQRDLARPTEQPDRVASRGVVRLISERHRFCGSSKEANAASDLTPRL